MEYTVKQYAEKIGKSQQWVNRLIKEKKLTATKQEHSGYWIIETEEEYE